MPVKVFYVQGNKLIDGLESGAISRCGDEMMRVMLYEAAHSMLTHTDKWSRDEEDDRGAGAPVGRDHAPRLG